MYTHTSSRGYFFYLFLCSEQMSLFVYPDVSTAISGEFKDNGILISGREVSLKAATYDKNSNLLRLQISEEVGPEFTNDIATDTELSKNPLQRDPYEMKYVDIAKSEIPKAGEGVFLKHDVGSGNIVAYFNGVKFQKKDAFSWNPFKKKSVFLIDFEDDEGNEIFLDIPEKFVNTSQYNATSGHKVKLSIIVLI